MAKQLCFFSLVYFFNPNDENIFCTTFRGLCYVFQLSVLYYLLNFKYCLVAGIQFQQWFHHTFFHLTINFQLSILIMDASSQNAVFLQRPFFDICLQIYTFEIFINVLKGHSSTDSFCRILNFDFICEFHAKKYQSLQSFL